MKKGEVIKISYIGRLASGEIFDLTDEETAKKEKIFNPRAKYGPAPIIVGAGMVIPGLDSALEGMSVGEERKITVQPEQAFGLRDPKLIKVMPEKSFREVPQPGMIVDFGNIKGRVQSVSAGRVRIDFNHPLAGKVLSYEIKIEEKIDGVKEKIASILEFFAVKAEVLVEGEKAKIQARLPQQLKDKISDLVLKNTAEIKSVDFVETYESKKEDKPEPSEKPVSDGRSHNKTGSNN